MKKIVIYDTSLRDGNQAEDVNFTLEDKIKISLKLDQFGVHYIEGGWPGASPVDTEYFTEIKNFSLKNSKIAAFGSTYHPQYSAETDPNLAAIIQSSPDVATIFGKSCALHVQEALRMQADEYLEIVYKSIVHLKKFLPEVIFDAEHFFDGYARDPEYSLKILNAAVEAGASYLVLCDTNGGSLPHTIYEVVKAVHASIPNASIGIHAHNDCELAVANSIAAVEAGASMVQGTINGIGERCGNANLCSVIAILATKYPQDSYEGIPLKNLTCLQEVSHYVAEIANISPFSRQAFVGRSAFAHKGGIHVSAVNRNSSLYEHISPELVGNRQRILLTELAGRSNIVSLAKKFGFTLHKDEPVVKGLLTELKEKASQGYDYAAAEASVELLLLRKLARRGVRNFFSLKQLRVFELKNTEQAPPISEATVTVEVEGSEEHTAAFGHGPVNALDSALRKALSGFYPNLKEMRLVDFKVRVFSKADLTEGTASQVRVLIESADMHHKWVTVGVSHDIIEASWQALCDSINYKLYKDENKLHSQRES